MGAPYIYDISRLRVKLGKNINLKFLDIFWTGHPRCVFNLRI
jgi:hypothetical protein